MRNRLLLVATSLVAAAGLAGCSSASRAAPAASSSTPASASASTSSSTPASLTTSASAASNGPTDPAGKPSLTVWVDTARQPAAEMYKKSVDGKVVVNVVVVAQDQVRQKIQLANQTKSGWPDVLFGQPNDAAIFSDESNGFAATLDDAITPEVKAGYGTGNQWCTIGGKTFCVKNDIAASVLWYNTKLFKDNGLTVPATMQDYSTQALKLKGKGLVAGAVGDGNDFYANYLWPSECPLTGGSTTEIQINAGDQKCTRVADLVQPLIEAGVVDHRSPFDAGFIKDVAQKDKVAMFIGPTWFGDFVIKPADSWKGVTGEWAAAPMPAWDAGSPKSGEWGGGIWAVSSHSKFPKSAADAAIYLATSADVQTASPSLPAYQADQDAWGKKLADSNFYASDPYPALKDAAKNLSDSQHPVRVDMNSAWGSVLGQEITAGKPVKQAISDFADNLKNQAPQVGYTVK